MTPTRAVTAATRLGLGALALACAVGLALGAWPIWREAMRGVWHPSYVIAVIVAAGGGAAIAWRWRSPGDLLAALDPRAFAGLAFALALASGIWAHWKIQKGVPDIPDELGYLHQARTFAHGHLAAPSPPAPEFHYVSWGTHDGGIWYAVFPPGFGLLLAIGVVLGMPWLINPLLGAALALVVWALGKELAGGDGVAPRVAVVLYLGSWFRLMHAGSYMSHPTAALFGALAVLGLWRGVIKSEWRWAAVGGAALAYLGATRQLDAVIVAAAIAPAVAWGLANRRRAAVKRLALAAACALPIAGAYLAYNHALTGSAWLPPQQRYMQLKEKRGDCFRLGFGPGVGECPITQSTSFGKQGFQPKDAVTNTRRRLDAWTRYSFGWSPLVVLPLIAMVGGAIAGGAAARRRALIAAMFAATVGGYGLFFYHGVAYGARFYYVAFPFAILLSGAAIADLGGWLARVPRGRIVAGGLGGALPALVIAGMIAQWPAIDRHAGQRNRTQNGKVLDVLARPELRDALVFVDSQIVPAAMTFDPTDIDDNHPLVVKDLRDAADAGFARIHPDRRPVRLDGLKIVPLTFAPDAPMRHEGGALYPLEHARGGFGDRATAPAVNNLPISGGEILRFTLDARAESPGHPARFDFPIWAIAADAGDMTLALQVAAHPGSPPIDVYLDGAAIARGLATDAASWTLVELPIAVTLTPGGHRLAIEFPTGRRNQQLFLDYAELRRR